MLTRLLKILYRLFIVVFLFTICRLAFLILNWETFTPMKGSQLFNAFFFGIRFDYAILFYLNLLWIVFMLMPGIIYNKKWYQVILKALFLITNSLLLMLNIADISYFKFINARSGFEVIETFFTSSDVMFNLPSFMLTYWYLLIVLILLIWLMAKLYNRTFLVIDKLKEIKWYWTTALYLCFFAISMLAARGLGVQPLRMISATEYVSPKYVPLILNTPFAVVNTIGEIEPDNFNYFNTSESLEKAFSPKYKISKNEDFKPLNVIIVIMESFSMEYIGAYNNGVGFTPHLDSLIANSYACSNTVANSRRSVDALPAILSSLPSLANKSYIDSKYSVNKLNSLPAFLEKKGYSTSFFHGGSNGTMGFDSFCKSIGIDSYYGLNEFPDKTKDDGNWGIPDHYFFPYMIETLNKTKRPFFSCVFTLSSHHPYKVPDEFADKFKGGSLPILKTVEYTDYALSEFMKEASKQEWFNNTLFVFTADHTAEAISTKYKTRLGAFRIPIAFYHPGNNLLKENSQRLTQHIDIMPSVLDYLNYDTSFVCFGSSVFDTITPKFGINSINENYFYFNDSLCGTFNGEVFVDLYNHKKDTLLQNNILGSVDIQTKTEQTKAYLQQFYKRLVSNTLNK